MPKTPTPDDIIAAFDYDPKAGTLRRRGRTTAPATLMNGYPVAFIAGKQWPVATLVWILETGKPPRGRLRRLDGDPLNTRIDNLAEFMVKPAGGWWDNERDNPAVARHRAWCKRNGVKPIGDGMVARLLDPGE